MKTTYIKQVVASLLLAGVILPSTASAQTTAVLTPTSYSLGYILYSVGGLVVSILGIWLAYRFFWGRDVPPPPPPPPFETYTFQTPQGVFSVSLASIAGGSPITVGRSRSCTLQLADSQVSKNHGIISVVNGILCFTDIGSSNGTYINGHRIPVNQPQPIQRGTCITLANRVNINVM